jgi:hypothetical protein
MSRLDSALGVKVFQTPHLLPQLSGRDCTLSIDLVDAVRSCGCSYLCGSARQLAKHETLVEQLLHQVCAVHCVRGAHLACTIACVLLSASTLQFVHHAISSNCLRWGTRSQGIVCYK